MHPADEEKSLGDAATFQGRPHSRRSPDDVSLGDERTRGDSVDEADLDAVMDDVEIVDLDSRYKVEGTLGQGGMGAVLLATDTRLNRKVAIKRILGEAARSKTAIQRFLTEATAIASLNHPNVVQIYDYGRAKDGPFLIMEFVDGGSLLDRCRQNALPLDEAIHLICQICDGLTKAHVTGIIHRDIKPANILLNRDGVPKLTDFGLAKAESTNHDVTMAGAVMGTPDFMPPEQRRDASEVDARSDLWSLAATFYQMITGRSPKIIRFNDVPPVLQDVLSKALEDQKSARYQTARDLRDAIRAAALSAKQPATATSLGAGQCPACGGQNEAGRKFCRNCGRSLEDSCLSCSCPMPLWEEICGMCGAKQTPLAEARLAAIHACQQRAESLLDTFAFSESQSQTQWIRDNGTARLSDFTEWCDRHDARIQEVLQQQTHRIEAAVQEALAHEHAHDYSAGVRALDAIPASLRTCAVSSQSETVEQVLSRLTALRDEARHLEATIRKAIGQRELTGLLPSVERLALLRPSRPDVIKLRDQLRERLKLLVDKRAEYVSRARQLIDSKNYPAAIAQLVKVNAEAINDEVATLKEACEERESRAGDLVSRIIDAEKAGRSAVAVRLIDEYLELKPPSAKVTDLRSKAILRMKTRRTRVKIAAVGVSVTALVAVFFIYTLPAIRRQALRITPSSSSTLAAATPKTEASKTSPRQPIASPALQPQTASIAPATKVFALDTRDGLLFPKGLIAFYPFNGDARDVVSSINGSSDPTVHRNRGAASAIRESGDLGLSVIQDGGVTIPDDARLGLTGADGFSICIWARRESPCEAFFVLSKAEGPGPHKKWLLCLGDYVKVFGGPAQPRLGMIWHSPGLTVNWVASDPIAWDEEWHSYVVTKAANTFRFYVDGKPLGSQESKNGIEPNSGTVMIGISKEGPDRFPGSIDNVRFYDRCLSSADVQVLYDIETRSAVASVTRSEIENSVGMRFTHLTAGEFTMGDAVPGRNAPDHKVVLTTPFAVGIHEVTNRQWKAVMGDPPSQWKEDGRPVENVTWDDAVSFCQRLTELPEERAAGRRYRLPTEAEWEYACRAGSTTEWSFGDDDSLLREYGWFADNANHQTHDVGQKRPNAWGLYDMHGNVWEWCADWYAPYSQEAAVDPIGPPSGSYRFGRGGCWADPANACRSAIRGGRAPEGRQNVIGFRVVLDCPPPSPEIHDSATTSRQLTDGLVAYYPFNGDATDATGNKQDATTTGTTFASDRLGQADAACEFDSPTDSITQHGWGLMPLDTDNFSVFMWICPRQLAGDARVLFSNQQQDQFQLAINDNRIEFYTGGRPVIQTRPLSWDVNAWYQLGVTRQGTSWRIYRNGDLAGTAEADIGNDAEGDARRLTFGVRNRPRPQEHPFIGILDDVRIYKRTLSADEVAALFAHELQASGL